MDQLLRGAEPGAHRSSVPRSGRQRCIPRASTACVAADALVGAAQNALKCHARVAFDVLAMSASRLRRCTRAD